MGLTKVAITRPVFILMLMLAAMLLGTMSLRQMRVELNPEVSFGVLNVTTVYPGAGPEEVNELISRKMEEAVSGVNGIREVTSTSQEGVSNVVIQFELGTDLDNALNETRSKIDQVVGSLPQGVEKPVISKFDTASEPVFYMALSSNQMAPRDLRDLADKTLKDRFARIKGVAAVGVTGGDTREIQIRLRKDKLLAYKLGIQDVYNAIRSATLNVPSGRIVDGETEYSVRLQGEFQTVEEIQQMPIRIRDAVNPMGRGQATRLGEIADVVDTVQERREYSLLNGNDTIVMVIQKAREGNAIEISKAANALIPLLEKDYGGKLTVTRDTAIQISESIFDVQLAIFFGIFLVTLIIYVFLHNFRGTLIVAIAIPICIFATFIVIRGLGFTLNNLTMLAISLAVGVLVDDAIVVLENIFRHLKMGEDPEEAALNGRGEIGLAAIAITLADVVVFLPIAFAGGISGQFFKPLGITFAVCVLISLLVSFTITPMLAARWYRKGEDVEHPKGWFAQGFEKVFTRFEQSYRRTLEWALKNKWFIFNSGFVVLFGVFMMIGGTFAQTPRAAIESAIPLLGVAMIIGLIVFAVHLANRRFRPQVFLFAALFGLFLPICSVVGQQWRAWKGEDVFKFVFIPPTDSGQIGIDITLPPGSSLDRTRQVVDVVTQRIQDDPDIKYLLTTVGTASAGGFAGTTRGSNTARISVTLNDKAAPLDQLGITGHAGEKLRLRSADSVASDLLVKVGRIPGADIKIAQTDQQGFGAAIQMSFISEDRELLLRTVEKIKNRLRDGAVKGVINADISSKPGRPEIRAFPKRELLADSGVTAADIANSMRILYEGNDDTKFRVKGEEYGIRVMMDLKDRNDPSVVQSLPITFNQGQPILLSQVASIQTGTGIDKIERRDRTEEIRVTADLIGGRVAGSVQREIDQLMLKEKLIPEGVLYRALGQADAQQRESVFLFTALFLGIILVYMLLASLYDNLLYPLIIQLAQPQAMVGALLALMITDKAMNVVAFIGIIALVGLVGKNAILLVDYTNTLRERGRPRWDALLESGPARLRPIMMTTLALVLGLLPVALAIGRGSEFRETIGIVIIGGILVSTVLTLLVIPSSYLIIDDLSNWVSRKIFRREPRGFAGDHTPQDGA